MYRFVVILLGMVSVWGTGSQAATYNFIFNNTEQGDNGVANPNVTVEDPAAESKQSHPARPVEPVPENQPGEAAGGKASPSSSRGFGVGIGATGFNETTTRWGALGSLSYHPIDMIGVSAFLGTKATLRDWEAPVVYGTELDIAPIALRTTAFQDGIRLGLIVGAMEMSNRGEHDSQLGGGLQPFAGARAVLRASERLDLRFGARYGVIHNSPYVFADAGIGVQL